MADNTDYNDMDASVNPGPAQDPTNGTDDNCDGEIDNAVPGDIDGNGMIDLDDVLLALQVIAGHNQAGIDSRVDINGDGKIGMEEVIHSLQKISARR